MTLGSPAWMQRLPGPALSVIATVTCALALGVSSAHALPRQPATLVPFVVGGQESSISQFPWQVFVLLENAAEARTESCGGSILDATHVLTAAHCVEHQGTTTPFPASDVTIIAGASEVLIGVRTSPPSAEQRKVKSLRTHPYYAVLPETKDDVAVLELSTPLELSSANGVQPIALAPTGATPAPGTPLSVSGYGKQQGGEGSEPNGKLFGAGLSALSSDACRSLVGLNSAVLLCAQSPAASTCQGDSGGPLTEGSPAVQVGIVDFGVKECPVGQPGAFTNVTAPEVRAFIEGSESPPVAARGVSAPVLRGPSASPVDYSPLSCEPGAWSGAPSFSYSFQVDSSSAQLLQSAASNVFAPPSSVVGLPVVCIVQASNAGGVSTLRTGTTPPIGADTGPPVASITAVRCRLQACTLALAASDPNGVAFSLSPTASYAVSARCPKPKRKHRRGAGRRVCHRTVSVKLPVRALIAPAFEASAGKLPYGEPVRFSVLAINAAGLRQTAKPTVRTVTLHKPKPKKRNKGRRH